MTTDSKADILCQDILATRVAQMLAKREDIPLVDALRKLMSTETYALLLDAESFLCMESAEYVLCMYDAEQRGDWNYWLEM